MIYQLMHACAYSSARVCRCRSETVSRHALPTPFRKDADSTHLETFLTELRAIRHVRHSSVASFFGASIDTQSRTVTLVYELIGGTALHVYAKQPRFSPLHRYQVVFQASVEHPRGMLRTCDAWSCP